MSRQPLGMRRIRGVRRVSPFVAGVVAVSTVLGCSGQRARPTTTTVGPSTTSTIAPSTTTAAAAPVAPLTGLPGDAATAARPAIEVKIDNAPQARPQGGLQAADIVYEEVVEGGVVRFMAVFQSKDAPSVGPVRSVRPVDANLVGPLRGAFAFSGGAGPFVALIQKAPVVLVGIDQATAAYTRRNDRKSPHNLFSSTPGLFKAAAAAQAVGPPPAVFAYRAQSSASTAAGVTAAQSAHIVMGKLTDASWAYDTGRNVWLRTTNGTAHMLEDTSQISAVNIVVVSCQYRDTGVIDASGTVSPEAIVIGGGDAMVLTSGPSGGQLVKGRWSKGSQAEIMQLTDQAGGSIAMAPGPTWVMLAPIGAPISVS